MTDESQALMVAGLSVAVPAWMDKLRGCSPEEIRERSETCADFIAGPAGADILFPSEKKGANAEAFNRLAEGLACVALCRGYVELWGLRIVAPGEVDRVLRAELESAKAGIEELTAMHRDAVHAASVEHARALAIRRKWQELKEWAQSQPAVLDEMDALEAEGDS